MREKERLRSVIEGMLYERILDRDKKNNKLTVKTLSNKKIRKE